MQSCEKKKGQSRFYWPTDDLVVLLRRTFAGRTQFVHGPHKKGQLKEEFKTNQTLKPRQGMSIGHEGIVQRVNVPGEQVGQGGRHPRCRRNALYVNHERGGNVGGKETQKR